MRKQRREEKPVRAAGPGGVDPDIAGIIPGPQPIADDDGLDRLDIRSFTDLPPTPNSR